MDPAKSLKPIPGRQGINRWDLADRRWDVLNLHDDRGLFIGID